MEAAYPATRPSLDASRSVRRLSRRAWNNPPALWLAAAILCLPFSRTYALAKDKGGSFGGPDGLAVVGGRGDGRMVRRGTGRAVRNAGGTRAPACYPAEGFFALVSMECSVAESCAATDTGRLMLPPFDCFVARANQSGDILFRGDFCNIKIFFLWRARFCQVIDP